MRPDKRKLFAYTIIILFLGSTVAVALIQAFSSGEQEPIDLPEKVKYSQYTPGEESLLIRSGATVVSYSAPVSCQECEEKKNILRAFSETHEDFFVSIEAEEQEILSMKSIRGNVILTSQNITQEKIRSSYCNLTNAASEDCIISQL